MTKVVISKVNEVDIQVEAEPHILYELQDHFSFDVEGASFSPAYRNRHWNGKIYLFSVNTKRINGGLVYRLCKFLDKHGYEWEFQNNKFYGAPYELDTSIHRKSIESFMKNISSVPPRDYQIEAVYTALKEFRKTIVSPTGSGKSLCIYSVCRYVSEYEENRTLIVVPTKSLVEQMAKDFEDYGWDPDNNHKIYQGKSLMSDCSVVISTWQSIYSLDKKWFRQFDCIVADECHQYKAKALQGIMKKCTDTKRRYGFTGTLDGKNVHKLTLEGLFGPVFKTTTTSDLMEKGLLAKLKVEIITLKHPHKAFSNYNEEIEYLCDLESRNKFITNLANNLNGNVLVLFTRVEGHGVPLAEMIVKNTSRSVHLIHGGTTVEEREQTRSIAESSTGNIIIGSYGTMSTGVNIKNIQHIVFASPSKSRTRVLQSIGRGLRKKQIDNKCMLYDIADDMRKNGGKSNYTLNHLKERIKFYIEENFDYRMTELNL